MNVDDRVMIFDDVFDDEYIMKLNKICDELPNKPNNIANRSSFPLGLNGTHNIMGCKLYQRRSTYVTYSICPLELMEAFEHFANNVAKRPFDLWGIESNMQVMGMDGSPHKDLNGDTIILMTNYKWEKEWGGEFQIMDHNSEEVVKNVDYKPGRIIYFSGDLIHRGLAPKVPYVYRHSIAFRVR